MHSTSGEVERGKSNAVRYLWNIRLLISIEPNKFEERDRHYVTKGTY